MKSENEILEYIEKEQSGKTWIYPFVLAEHVARVFDLKISKAEELVWKHVHRVIGEVANDRP